ncbi:hypothetical protein NDU88_004946 [Pleurodeles waltl]|uniref:Uncharacterized protein n=1 Tax=Pleurodeles waltl TaxID=8319 RepID=A0AAV7RIT0_PLEWA|nr:hypothetical protein NDU88_004946 [Pleurodeles waltl]
MCTPHLRVFVQPVPPVPDVDSRSRPLYRASPAPVRAPLSCPNWPASPRHSLAGQSLTPGLSCRFVYPRELGRPSPQGRPRSPQLGSQRLPGLPPLSPVQLWLIPAVGRQDNCWMVGGRRELRVTRA